MDGGVPAARRRGRAGGDRLGVLASGLAQMRVRVDQARQRQQTVRLDPLGVADVVRGYEHAVADAEVTGGAVGQRGTGDQQVSHSGLPPSRWYSTLIRTDTPAVTWSRISELAASAASDEISRPRFIGPGWQIAAPGRSRASRSGVSP